MSLIDNVDEMQTGRLAPSEQVSYLLRYAACQILTTARQERMTL